MKSKIKNKILCSVLTLAMVFTGIGIGDFGVDVAEALSANDVHFYYNKNSGEYFTEAVQESQNEYNIWVPESLVAKNGKIPVGFKSSEKLSYYTGTQYKNYAGTSAYQLIAMFIPGTGITYIKSQDESETYTYHVKVYASLSGLSVAEKDITPAFVWGEKDYTVATSSKTETISVKVTTPSIAATRNITVNNQNVTLKDGSGNVEIDLSKLTWNNNEVSIPIAVSDAALEKGSEYTLKVVYSPNVKIVSQSDTGDKEYYDNETKPTEMSVTASAPTAISYQWYAAKNSDLSDGTIIDGATNSKYTPIIAGKLAAAETTYYYCVAKNTVDGTDYTATSNPWKVTVKPGLYPTVTLGTADGTTIPTDGYSVNAGETIPTLKANVSLPEGYTAGDNDITYEWLIEENQLGSTGIKTQTYAPSANRDSINHYYCKVTYKYDGKEFTSYSDSVKVSVFGYTQDTFSYSPGQYKYADREINVGNSAKMSVNVSVPSLKGEKGELHYQWQHSTDGTNFEPMHDMTQSVNANGFMEYSNLTFDTPIKDNESTDYYRCKFVYNGESISKPGETLQMELITTPVKITTKAFAVLDGFKGDGTQKDPYLLESIDDLQKLKEKVNAENGISCYGLYFRLEDNITIPKVGWTPIGTETSFFSGNIDGNGKTLTIESGGKSLLGYVRDASVSNLNLKGDRINGYGLVENYVVDYATKETITITNVTIKSGTNIVKSGFIGGYASGQDSVYIINCKIEKGVVIGCDKDQDNIGGFAGEFNGTIINCVNEGDVYGKNFVGGIIGDKGQCMGDCFVRNCTFSGKVEATGNYVGGIAGAAYGGTKYGVGSAPNTPCITIQNCISYGTVIGNNYVGGILGAEPGVVQCWGEAYLTDNLFVGTVNASAADPYIGGIAAYINSLNKYNIIENNFFAENCGSSKGIGYVKLIDTDSTNVDKTDNTVIYVDTSSYSSYSAMKEDAARLGVAGIDRQRHNRSDDPLGKDKDKLSKAITTDGLKDKTILNLLNASDTSFKNWIQGENYPVHSAEPVLYEIELSGTYKTDYKTGDTFNTDGMVITGKLSDGSTKTIPLNDSRLKFTGYDMNKRAVQTVTVTYGVASTSYEIKVLYNDSQVKNDIYVYFTLLGDEKHPSAEATELGGPHTLSGGNLDTWIGMTKVPITNNMTVYDVFKTVLTEKSMSWEGSAENKYSTMYISGVQNPNTKALLSEFDNGPNSGWMYTLNGVHSDLGVAQQFLNSGDVIVFHYTDDYTVEEGSDKWGISGAVDEVKEVTSDKSTGTTTSPTDVKVSETTNADGTKETVATVTVSSDNQKEILDQANSNKSKEIILQVSKDSVIDATKVDVQLDKTFIESVATMGAGMTVKTPLGDKSYTNAELKDLVAATSGETVSIEIVKSDKTDEELKAEQIEQIKSELAKVNMKARSTKTAKGNVKVALKADNKTQKFIKEMKDMKDMGYTVKYRFYRSTKKSSGYKSMLTKTSNTYTNTAGKKGVKYYYKVQVRVYDENGKCVAKTALKQCDYAYRTWTK